MALTLCLALCLVTIAIAQPNQPTIGFKGPNTPQCADGTIYATSRSTCSYPSAAILAWVQQNNAGYQQLYSSVAVQTTIPNGQFPKQVTGKESCDFSEDYAALQWVFSPDLGWMPVMQSPNAPQYFRLESCTSRACNAGCGGTGNCQTQCRTFHTRQRVLVWNGVQAVSTVVLLPYACKCVIDSPILPGVPNLPLPPFTPTCNPYMDCTCPCAAYDSACISTRIASNQCRAPGLPQPTCNPYFDCACACAPNDWNCLAYRQKVNPCLPAIGQPTTPTCNPATDCTCPCREDDFACVSAHFQNPQCYAPPRDCDPYLSCQCDCGWDYRCVSYRAMRGICPNALVTPVAAPAPFPYPGPFLEPLVCDPYRHCRCPCPGGDWNCYAAQRENCGEHKRWEGHHRRHDFGSRSGSGSSSGSRSSSRSHERNKESSSSSGSGENKCHCNSLKWGPWCKDPQWRCLTDEQRLKLIG